MSKVLQMAKANTKTPTKHYYHAHRISSAGRAMQSLLDRCQQAEQAAMDWVQQQGGESYLESPFGLAGGVTHIIFDHQPDLALWTREDDVDVETGFDAEQIAQGAGLYKVNIPDDFNLKPYLSDDKPRTGMAALKDRIKGNLHITPKPGTPIALAVERMRLPMVTMLDLLSILQPEKRMVKGKDGKEHILPVTMNTTPRFFQQGDFWYIETPMRIEAEGWQEISSNTFRQRLRQAMPTA